ncbi:uncharacterized protein J3R85_004295 [Psidium guajava]|nr:uncharacterized protein J3R85_004295 [Psidium guajava]
MLLPRKTIMKTQGAMTSSVPPLLDRPIGGLSSSIPERPISCGPYHLFMRDFRKSEDCKSAIKKAAAEKWASLSEGEKYAYELKMWERTSRFGQYIDAFRKLKQKQDDDEDEAKRSIPEVDAAKED